MNPPQTIYLQWSDDPDADYVDPRDTTWCADRINDNDFEYRLVEKG